MQAHRQSIEDLIENTCDAESQFKMPNEQNSHTKQRRRRTVMARCSADPAQRVGVALLALLAVWLSLAQAQSSSWHNRRVFDSLEGGGRMLGDFFSPFNNYFYTAALPPSVNQTPAQSVGLGGGASAADLQLLTPSTASSPASLHVPLAHSKPSALAQAAPSYDVSVTSAVPALVPAAEQLVRAPLAEQPPAAAPTTPTPTTTSTSGANTTSTTTSSTTRAPELRAPAELQQARNAQTNSHHDDDAATPPMPPPMSTIQQLSLVGKILDSASQAGVTTPTSNASEPAPKHTEQQSKLANVALQMLKARRKAVEQSQKAPSAVVVEQQIVNQHARAHHNHLTQRDQQQQQRLMPTRQRDNKLLGALLGNKHSSGADLAASSSSSSPLIALLGQSLKSMGTSISSRSSIVKAAISDNKLSRTLSTVSKSIGGNKYVAGAGAAAALAALGLTVSKFLGPYMYAGTSKLNDPLMTSGSYLAPSSSILPLGTTFLGGNTDRNTYGYAQHFDPLLSASSLYRPGYVSSAGASAPVIYAADNSASSYSDGSLEQQAALANYYAAQAAGQQQGAPDQAGYLAQAAAPARQRPTSAGVVDNTSGHYSSFYNGQGGGGGSGGGGGDELIEEQPQTFGSYLAGQPLGGGSSADQASGYAGAPLTSSASEQFASRAQDQIMSAASSLDAPSYSQQIPKFHLAATSSQHPQQQSAQARRSGPVVSIKLDEATRARLQQQLSTMQQQQQQRNELAASYAPMTSFGAAASGQQMLPMQPARQYLTPLTGAADSSADYASVAKWKPSSVPPAKRTFDSTSVVRPASAARNVRPMAAPEEGRAQQQQTAPAAYLLIRPITNSNSFAPLDQQQSSASGLAGVATSGGAPSSDNSYYYRAVVAANAAKQPSSQATSSSISTGGGWHSLVAPSGDGADDSGQQQSAIGNTISTNEQIVGRKQTSGAPLAPKQQQAPSLSNVADNNVLVVEPQDSNGGITGALRRVSRTPPQAIVIAQAKTKQKQLRLDQAPSRQRLAIPSSSFAKERAQDYGSDISKPVEAPLSPNDDANEPAQDNVQLAGLTMPVESSMMNLIQLNGSSGSGSGSVGDGAQVLGTTDKNKQSESDATSEVGAKSLATREASMDSAQLAALAAKRTLPRQQINNNNEDDQLQTAINGGHTQQVANDEHKQQLQRQQAGKSQQQQQQQDEHQSEKSTATIQQQDNDDEDRRQQQGEKA